MFTDVLNKLKKLILNCRRYNGIESITEIDKFLTKYKSLKASNQALSQFKSEVKTALNTKRYHAVPMNGGEVVQAITNYNPPK